MATGRPPWSQQYQEVAALFHIGTTKSHPPIPEHLSYEEKDFLLKCLQKEPNLRPTAFELLQHPFVTGDYAKSHHAFRTSVVVNSESPLPTSLENYQTTFRDGMTDACSTVCPTRLSESRHIWETNASDGDMCQFDGRDYLPVDEVKTSCVLMPDDFIKSFNPMCEPSDDWGCKLDGPLEPEHREMNLEIDQPCYGISGCCREVSSGGNILLFPSGPSLSEDDEELTESKIRVFLDEKAGELKKLQTPLYEEYYHIMGATCSPNFVERNHDEIALNYVKLPPKSSSPSRGPIGTLSPTVVAVNTLSPGSSSRCVSNVGSSSDPTSQDILSSPLNDQKGVIGEAQQEPSSPSASLSERLRKWKEELDEELERTREMKRQAGVGRKSVSPKDRALIWQRERTRFGSPGK